MVTATVRFYTGTYIARAKGKTASCTIDAEHAVRALAAKLGFKGTVELQRLPRDEGGKETWQISEKAVSDDGLAAVLQMKKGGLDTLNLALRIADGAVRSDIECYAAYLGGQRYDLGRPSERGTPEEEARDVQRAQEAARYIDLRGNVFPWRLVHDATNHNLVRFKVNR